MMSQWAKNNNEDQMSSLLKKKIFKDVCMFNSSEEIWTLQNHRNSQDDNHHTIQGNQMSFTWFSKPEVTAGKWS